MAPASTLFLLPASLLAFVSQALADNRPFPIAIKKQSPGSGEKILREHLAFAPLPQVRPVVASSFFDVLSDEPHQDVDGTSRFYPPFVKHLHEAEDDVLRRAAEALALLERRSSCPSGMNNCAQQGSPNKCCQQGTYCTDVPDTDVGHVACCPNGSTCGGEVGTCPSGATSCAAALGGGCCIPGYVCQGVGCVPSASATPTTVTQTAPPEVTTRTTTQIVTPSSTSTSVSTDTKTDSAAGNPPWRLTGSSEITSAPGSTSITQSGCPTGFYGCLATHGGGCCQTDRDCHTYSCPAPSSTTLVSNGATVVVPAAPNPTRSSSCADGWLMCGQNAGPVAGCCPSGYSCGTASCFTAGATETGKIQKQAPDQSPATKTPIRTVATWMFVVTASLFLNFGW
ncbi:hypothetical protein J3458_005479 [Metarhizium acridum]|uniref:uncharacterized protein n=1 Tax=Metarhizium acridum TaxID=92637 RepID=UPI001C6C0BAA|nr:hypothetical protein J3458_005479 [Metarhizium acridum]